MSPIDVAIANLEREGRALTAYLAQCRGVDTTDLQSVLNTLEIAILTLEQVRDRNAEPL